MQCRCVFLGKSTEKFLRQLLRKIKDSDCQFTAELFNQCGFRTWPQLPCQKLDTAQKQCFVVILPIISGVAGS